MRPQLSPSRQRSLFILALCLHCVVCVVCAGCDDEPQLIPLPQGGEAGAQGGSQGGEAGAQGGEQGGEAGAQGGDQGGEAGAGGVAGEELFISGCEEISTLESRAFEQDLTLNRGGCYLLSQSASLSTHLTLEPGVTLLFAEGVSLRVYEGGELTAIGSEDAPITLRGVIDSPGFWRGLQVKSLMESRLEWVKIQHAGESTWTSAELTNAALYVDGRLTMSHVEVSDNAGFGVIATQDANLTGLGALTIAQNERAMWLDPDRVGELTEALSVVGNHEQVIRVGYQSELLLTPVQRWLPFDEAPYHVTADLDLRAAQLTLEAGVTLVMSEGGMITVDQEGELIARGTAERPVTLTGASPRRGFWKGVRIKNLRDNVLTHLTIEHAGGGRWTGVEDSSAALWLEGELSLSHVTFRENAGVGLFVTSSADLLRFEATRFERNERVMWLLPEKLGALSADAQITNNDEQAVRVGLSNSDAVLTAQTWPRLEAPYLFTHQALIKAPLTISAGARLTFLQDAALRVQDEGSLSAVGTADAPIELSGLEALSGSWRGLQFKTTNDNNRLEHVTLSYAGHLWTGSAQSLAALHLTRDATLHINHLNVLAPQGSALYIDQRASLLSCAGLSVEGAEGASVVAVLNESSAEGASCE